MDLIFPGKNHGIIPTPIHGAGDNSGFGVVLAEFVLEVDTDDPQSPLSSEKCHKTSGRRYADKLEWPVLQDFIFCFI
jgi:hypothetical protein